METSHLTAQYIEHNNDENRLLIATTCVIQHPALRRYLYLLVNRKLDEIISHATPEIIDRYQSAYDKLSEQIELHHDQLVACPADWSFNPRVEEVVEPTANSEGEDPEASITEDDEVATDEEVDEPNVEEDRKNAFKVALECVTEIVEELGPLDLYFALASGTLYDKCYGWPVNQLFLEQVQNEIYDPVTKLTIPIEITDLLLEYQEDW